MKLVLLLLTFLALSEAKVTKCVATLPFKEVCAFQNCYLNIAQKDLQYLNCDREQRGKPPLNFVAEGKCDTFHTPKCKTFDYK